MGSVAPAFPYTVVVVVLSRGQVLASTVRQQEQKKKLVCNNNIERQQALTSSRMMAQVQQPAQQESEPLHPDWIALQDPASRQTYYANQTTGYLRSTVTTGSCTTAKLDACGQDSLSHVQVWDCFVTSLSHPELSNHYGNLGTSNSYS